MRRNDNSFNSLAVLARVPALSRMLLGALLVAACSIRLGLAAVVIPNDPRFPVQWNLSSIGAPNAWSFTTGATNAVVVVIDTGVDYTHPDLAANMWRNPGETGFDAAGNDKSTNGIDDDDNGYVDDVHGVDVTRKSGDPMDSGFWAPPDIPASAPMFHGTAIAGIIGAVGNNSLGVAGLNWTARIMAIRVFGGDVTDLQGESDTPFYRHILAAFDYVIAMKRRGVNIRVVSSSWYTLIAGESLNQRMRELEQEDVLCVFAAGDFLVDLDTYSNYPGTLNYGNLVVVATSDQAGALRPLSPFGSGTVDLAAAGVEITSTTKGGYASGYLGTSFAAPLVAGSAALLLAKDPSLSVDRIKAALYGSVDQHSSLKGKVVTNGRLNVARAFDYLADSNPPAIVITALPAGQNTALDAPIQVTFNRPMDRSSVESAFAVQPHVSGRFTWNDDATSFSFSHDEPFDRNTRYVVSITGSAQDESGATLDGDFDRVREGSPADDFRWSFGFRVPNDDFSGAGMLIGASGEVKGTTRFATWEEFEPQPTERGALIRANTVWYRWTAPVEGGWFTFDLGRSAQFDSLIEIFSGEKVSELSLLGVNDNVGTQLGSRITFRAASAKEYVSRVSGKNAFDPLQAGPFTLQWYPTPAPGFSGAQFSPSSGVPGAKITLSGTNFTGATAVLFNGVAATFTNAPTNNLDLRITAIVPSNATSGPITILTPHGNVTSTASFTVLRPALSFTRTGSGELVLNWEDPAVVLESSADLSAWRSVVLEPGLTNFAIRVEEPQSFFRLRKP